MFRAILKFFGIATIDKQYRNKTTELRVKSRRIVILSHIANVLSTLSLLGLAALGTIEASLLASTLIFSAILLVAVGVLGKTIDYHIRSTYRND